MSAATQSTAPVSIEQLREKARLLRIHSLQMTTAAGSGHPTSCLSAAELMAGIFFHAMKFDPANPNALQGDRFVLSKGHAAPVLYAALAEAGVFPVSRLATLRQLSSELEGHPTPLIPGVDAATGSLGQGLSVGAGLAMGARVQNSPARVYVLLGDGELAEAQGWHAEVIDGQDIAAVVAALDRARATKGGPQAIIARTLKGAGISFLADKEHWHGKALSKEELAKALAELGTIPAVPPDDGKSYARKALPAPPDFPALAAPEYTAGQMVATREAFGSALKKLAGVNPKIFAVDGDVKNSTFSEVMQKAYPGRLFQGYIAEQNMVSAGVGLA